MTQNEEKKQYKFFQTPKVLKKLDPYEWVLFTVLFDEWQMMKNEEGWFFRSEEELSEDTGLSPATIYRRTKSLEEKGLILVKRHSDGKTKSERYKSNDYKINIETVISLAPIESHQKDDESHHRDEPTKNIILLSTIYTMEFLKKRFPNGIGPEDYSSDMCDKLESYLNNRMSERSDNGATVMNDTISSTLENTINTMENDPNPAPASQTQNKATGEPQTSEVEQLSKEEKIKRQEARKEEIRLFNAGHDEHREDICHNVKSTADYERFYGLLQKDIDYVKNSDWAQKQKDIWFNSFNKFWDNCEPYIKKNLNKVQEREKRRMQKEEEKRNKNSNTTLQQPIRYLEKNIKPIDVRIFQYWINEREKTDAQEQKNNAQNMIDTLLSEWGGKYDADSIAKVCQECNLKASGEHQTAKVEQLPTKGKITQYKPLEEECGDFVNDNLKIHYINKPSAQVAN